jgi:tetratricopeptide (TPR) repeat protein
MQKMNYRQAEKQIGPTRSGMALMASVLCLLLASGCDGSATQKESSPVDAPVASSAETLTAEAVQHFYRGESAAGFRLATQAHELDPNDRGAYFAFTIGLLQTQQNGRLVEEGLDGFRVDALDVLGRRSEAFELAQTLADGGSLQNLFTMYNRAGRSLELVDYLESRWLDLNALSIDHPHSGTGYGLMAQVALAYSRVGNVDKSADALSRVAEVMSTLADEGVDNMVFKLENAVYFALAGRHEDAITQMERAVEQGLRGNPALDWSQPAFAPLSENSRFIALCSHINDKVNEQRHILGLDPLNPVSHR